MTERPILSSSTDVRAILDGRKTQMRRILKMPTSSGLHEPWQIDQLCTITSPHPQKGKFGLMVKRPLQMGDDIFERHMISCPYGNVGDELWVKEEHYLYGYWITDGKTNSGHPKKRFVCDREFETLYNSPGNLCTKRESEAGYWKRNSLFMPRWASRIQLRITDIRVERLQDISDGDAIKEGCFFTDYGNKCYHPKPCPLPEKHAHHPIRNGWKCYETKSDAECLGNPRMGFANLWEEINTAQGKTWANNPLVWVVEFKKQQRNCERNFAQSAQGTSQSA